MITPKKNRQRIGFTLVELLVVIFIIGILITILIPAISAARTKAKNAAVKSQFVALDAGLELFRGEQGLGGDYPPSQTDDLTDHRMMADPLSKKEVMPDTIVSGAHLLFQAMLGADQLGPVGFKDWNNDGFWSDDTHADPDSMPPGAYALDTDTQDTLRPRYGTGGFVNDQARARARTLDELVNQGSIVSIPSQVTDKTRKQFFFVDAFERPVLYYRANPSSKLITGSNSQGAIKPGIFTQEDNGIITGSNVTSPYSSEGIDFGEGSLPEDNSLKHRIAQTKYPDALPTSDSGKLPDKNFDNTFERFIWDRSIKVRNEPVRRDTFLLISAGPDGIYGSSDDITNWTRQK